MKVKSESEVAQSCPSLSHPTDCSLPGSSVHGIFQAGVLEWGAIAFSEPRLHIKKKVITLLTKVCTVKAMVLWLVMYRCESWNIKKAECQVVVLEKTLESPVDSQEVKPVNPKGNQLWEFIGRTEAEAKAPILWPPDGKSQVIGSDPDAGKDWRQKEKRAAEDEMLGCITDSMDMNLGKLWELVRNSEALCIAVPGVSNNLIQLSNWTTTNWYFEALLFYLHTYVNKFSQTLNLLKIKI